MWLFNYGTVVIGIRVVEFVRGVGLGVVVGIFRDNRVVSIFEFIVWFCR